MAIFLLKQRTVAEVIPKEGKRREVAVACVEAVILVIEVAVTHESVDAVQVVDGGVIA